MSDIIIPKELPEWHIESKATAEASLTRSTLTKWYEQLERDCPEALKPVLLHKANGKGVIAYVPLPCWKKISSGKPFNYTIYCEGDSINSYDVIRRTRECYNVEAAIGVRVAMPNERSVVYYSISAVNGKVFAILKAEEWLELTKG